MKNLILNKKQANLIQVALTHTYEEFLFLTPNQKDLSKSIIDNIEENIMKQDNCSLGLGEIQITNEQMIMIAISVSKWYQDYMDYNDYEDKEDKNWFEGLKVCATQVLDKLLNINKRVK